MWWARQGSNLQPTHYECAALTLELRARDGLETRWKLQSVDGRFGVRVEGGHWGRTEQERGLRCRLTSGAKGGTVRREPVSGGLWNGRRR